MIDFTYLRGVYDVLPNAKSVVVCPLCRVFVEDGVIASFWTLYTYSGEILVRLRSLHNVVTGIVGSLNLIFAYLGWTLFHRFIWVDFLILEKIFYRFSPDPDTSMGLVQHEGGPCGVLAAIQVILWFSLVSSLIGKIHTSTLNLSKKLSYILKLCGHLFTLLFLTKVY